MFVHNAWYPAAWDHEIGRHLFSRMILGQPVVFYRTEDGRPVAMEDRCPHRQLPLSMGELQGDRVQCGYHGLVFGTDGACVHVPGHKGAPRQARARIWPLVERYGLIWIWPGDPDLADAAGIIDIPGFDAAGWAVNRGPLMRVGAHYQLMMDNLVDPAHVSFVHKTTLASDGGADVPVRVENGQNHVAVSRWILDKPPAPFFARIADFPANVDRWQVYTYRPPSTAVIDLGSAPVGSGAPDGDRSQAVEMKSYNFVTPETERSSFYFWFQVRNFKAEDKALSERITEQFTTAFNEDTVVLEAIQRALDIDPSEPRVHLPMDAASSQSRRLVARMLEQERNGAN
ncbi:MAG: aromatic ring-hydroxylating dioxygenase subunit alpha [Alphaproteobacteria bacterium]